MKWLTFLSIVYPLMSGAMLLVWAPEDRKIRNDYIMRVVLITSGVVIATVLTTWFQGSDATGLHVLRMSQKLELAFRLDGPSMLFGLIIGVLWPVTTLYAFSYMEHEGHENKFFAFFIMTYGTVAGIAFSANMLTMYLCYELMTLATLPLVMHEMDGKARSAGQKYILYSMTGAALIFVTLIFLLEYGVSLDFVYGGILDKIRLIGHEKELLFIFVLGFFGFGVKAAVFPFHGWLPAASVAPTPVTALLHAVAVVKSGAFAVMRLIYFLFGSSFLFGTWAQYFVMMAAAVTIVYGSVSALRMPHLKRRLAFSTISNLSYILLSFAVMTPQGLIGGFLHMLFHAVCKITLFFCAGSILHHGHLEYSAEMEGLHKKMPVTCAVFLVAALALMGVPPFGGFLSKWTIATAASSLGVWAGYAGMAALIVSAVLTALYMLTPVIRFYFPLNDAPALSEHVHEADWQMTVPLVGLTVLLFALSLCTGPITQLLTGIGGVA